VTKHPEWLPIDDDTPRDRWIFVYAAPYTGGWDDPSMWLPGFVSLCRWHPDAGFCVDELREAVMWCPVVYPEIPAASAPGDAVQPGRCAAFLDVSSLNSAAGDEPAALFEQRV
jgi:hypothetical protein